ncbi:hypothetical protein GOODEAATRI_018245 [Goodea atripinnis]|uniref:Biogenesis of lysosome-related organelles complex 1 subunit 1 n=1 Tax=Goodea atripinnis TaxID=208336 RepID=A0ABV0NL83_9TELE
MWKQRIICCAASLNTMSKQITIKDCGNTSRFRSSQRPKNSTLTADANGRADEPQQADLASVLSELQSLRTTASLINTEISSVDGLGNKLDNVEKRLTEMNCSVIAVQGSFADLEKNITANAKWLTEAESWIGMAEDDLNCVRVQLVDAAKRIAYLESKTEDLENRGRRKNLRLVGLPESTEKNRPLVGFIQQM